jgi:cobalt-zinc-cadmium resistance protein CzcA
MIERLIRTALAQRLIVLLTVLGLIVSGVAAFRHLPIDAFPDVTPVQVQVITKMPALAPAEIERLVTFPLEIEFTNLPGKKELRSVSRFGLSVITVVFEDKMDIYFARQLVLERMLEARSSLPPSAEPELGPVSTGLSEVFMYLVEGSTQTNLWSCGPSKTGSSVRCCARSQASRMSTRWAAWRSSMKSSSIPID